MNKNWLFIFFFPLALSLCSAEEDFHFEDGCSSLFRDLEVVSEVDKQIHDQLPLVFNYLMQGGYFTMPSARMAKSGLLGFGFSYLPPYRVYSMMFQFFDRLELSGNYWVFHGQLDSGFGHRGFGDEADRAANFKFSLLRKSDGIPSMPEIAIGLNDFIGTKRFRSFYAVATQTFNEYNLELSLGWGTGRINGFFFGGAWTPFRKYQTFLKHLTLIAEYDANDYKRHKFEYEKGREVKFRVNAGVQLTLFDFLHLSVSSLRGNNVAASASITYNLGESKGFFPKIGDPAPYTAPIDTQALGELRSQEEMAHELAYAFQEQGLDIYTIVITPKPKGKSDLWIKIINVRYREENVVRSRIESVLASLAPSNLDTIAAVVEADGVCVQEYKFRMEELIRYRKGLIGEYELRTVAPLREATGKPGKYDSSTLYQRSKGIWIFTFRPAFRSYFGSSTGKFKYDVGFIAGPEGYLFDEIYYSAVASYTIKSSAIHLGSCDILNPSQIINVRSDSIRYHQSNSFHLDVAFVQKSWNLGQGWFTRLAAGYFETAYAGIAWESLYYPVYANWAVGFEAATFLKRKYGPIFGLTHKIRKLEGYCPTYVPFIGLQYFVNFYYQYKPFSLDFIVSIGQFLAKDKGIRMEVGRTFASGLRIGLWYAFTNANDRINDQRYFDKGFSITMPLDLFLTKSSRTRIGYAMSAWLRDIACKGRTGKELYHTIYYERYNEKLNFY